MPNATCFLIAYSVVFVLELARWRIPSTGKIGWWTRVILVAAASVSLFTHTLYLLDRIFLATSGTNSTWAISWHDWGILSAWTLAVAYGWLLIRRSENWIGIFVLPFVLMLVGVAIILSPKTLGSANSATGWRLLHGIAMMGGTMLVSLGFAMATMYFLQAWRLKNKLTSRSRFQLPSLEYSQSYGRICLLGSAASIGFGMVSGVIMNLTRDGRVEWLDRGILFSAGLFVWLVIASAIQWQLSRRGSGDATAWMNILSFLIVAAAVALVLSTPHGGNKMFGPSVEGQTSVNRDLLIEASSSEGKNP
ncbi:MAG: hypothetical protein ACK56W_08465 [Pirellula sp.]